MALLDAAAINTFSSQKLLLFFTFSHIFITHYLHLNDTKHYIYIPFQLKNLSMSAKIQVRIPIQSRPNSNKHQVQQTDSVTF